MATANIVMLTNIFFDGRDNGVDKVSDMCCRHLVRFFDSTGEGRLQYTE
jgi:hypothetical protein